MQRKRNRIIGRRKWAAVALLFPLLSACGTAGGASDGSGGKTAAIDPPPAQIEETMLQEAEGTTADSLQTSAGEMTSPKDTVTVYLQDQHGYLAPMTLRLESEGSSASESALAAAETAVSWLIDDPKRQDQLPEGFTAVLQQGTRVESVKLDTETGTAAVDFAAPLPGMPAAAERKMLEAVVWSLTELPGIDKVKLSLAGKPIRSLPASQLPVDEVLTRGIGINVEPTKGVQPSRAMGVTLYFSARSQNGDGYFVPVTRLIERTPDRMKAALSELIRGPSETSPLQDDLLPGFTIDSLTPSADTLNVSLRNPEWMPDQAVPSDMMEEIVLTMTEAAGVPKVKVALNGTDTFTDTQQRSYDRPVTRPVAVNALER